MDHDETFSWRAAFVIMGLVSLLAVIMRLLGKDLFTLEFESSILFLPTVLLLVAILYEWLSKGSSATKAVPKAEYTAV